MPVACLYVPDFPLAAWIRAQPELGEERLAIARTSGAQAELVAVSAAARQRGVLPGMRAAQAWSLDPSLLIRPLSPALLASAQAALADCAASFSPCVEDAGDGVVYLDLQGLIGTLFPSLRALATALTQRAARFGLPARVGVARTKLAARLAARQGDGVTLLAPHEESEFLAALPIAVLQPSEAVAATLQRWGIATLGQLAALPAAGVGSRLGPEGVALWRQARGEDPHPLVPRPQPVFFEEGIDLDYGVESLEPFAFVLRGLLERLTTRLAAQGWLCSALHLRLRLAMRQREEHTLPVAWPHNEVKPLLALLRSHLEQHPPQAPIEGVVLRALPHPARPLQLDLFRSAGPTATTWGATLTQVLALCGPQRCGTPGVLASHRPQAHCLGAFDPTQTARTSAPTTPVAPFPVLALRHWRPPRPVEVFCDRDRPDFVRGEGVGGRVVSYAGPWRLQGEWWQADAYDRTYYDVHLSDGGIYRVYREEPANQWFVEGVYD